MSSFDKITEMKARLQETIRNEGAKLLKEELDKLLESFPEVECILWAQNHNVYNDQGYEFRMFGIDFLPSKDCPWYNELTKELEDEFCSRKKSVEDELHFHGQSLFYLKKMVKKFPEHKDRIMTIHNTLYDFSESIPEEVLQIFGDVAVRVDRKEFTTQDYDCGY